jgi:hypothetical protein
MNDPQGSKWYKWDLHVHTPKSFVQEYGGDTEEAWEKFIADLEALPAAFKVIGINDYLFLEGYEKVLAYKAQGRLQNIELILPVIEFRLREFVGTDQLKRLNYHIIFADERALPLENIKAQFLSSLRGAAKLDVSLAGTTWGGVVSPRTLADLGAAIRKSTPAEKRAQLGASDLELGFNNINFELSAIEKILGEKGEENTYLRGKYLKAIGKSEWEAFRWEGAVADKKTIINNAHFIFCASATVEQARSSKQRLRDQEVNDRLLHCSDAHRFSSDPSPERERRIGKCFSWLKCDLTFEGLRQTLYEPERIQIQERNPSDSKPPRILIDRVTYRTAAGDEKVVLLNPDLNSIIGARGSGKSTLLRNIAYAVDPVQFRQRDPKREPYALGEFSVIWADGQMNGGSDESPKSVFYIPQGYLSNLSYDDGELTKQRDDFLTELLRKNARFSRALESYATFVSENEITIQSHIQDLVSADRGRREAVDQLKKLGSLKEISAEIDAKNAEMQKYKGTDLSDEELSRYARSKKELGDKTELLDMLRQDKSVLEALASHEVGVFVAENDLSPLSANRRDAIREGLRKKGREALDELVAAQLVEVDAQIQLQTEEAAGYQKAVDELQEKVTRNQAITDLSKELLQLEKTKSSITDLIQRRDRATEDYARSLQALVTANNEFAIRQRAIYGSIDLAGDFKFVNLKISTKYDTQQLRDFVERNINTRDSTVKDDPTVADLFSPSPSEPSPEAIRKLTGYLVEAKLRVKAAAGEVSSVLGELLKNRYIIDYPNSVKSSDGDIYFKDMTGGQRAIAFLELIFSLSDEKYPILIDQPEDDLDVSGIAKDLAAFIMREKGDRQIIVVSHNANLVVCSDSEEVLSSSMNRRGVGQYDFDYATGAIEHPERRSDIVRVLEGGEEALKRRMNKLRISAMDH